MNKDFNKVFSNRLRYYMDLYGMSQKNLAEKMNVSEASISNWISGRKVPRADKVDKLCSIFNCTRSDLVEEPSSEIESLLQKHIANYTRLDSEWQHLIDDLIAVAQEEPQDTAKILELIGKITSVLRS